MIRGGRLYERSSGLLFEAEFLHTYKAQFLVLCVFSHSNCRNQPGDPGFPTQSQWAQLNSSIGGRLLQVIPSAKFCEEVSCTEDQWGSTLFRCAIPGAMVNYDWEQDYTSNPPSLCLQNGTTCGQGDVPVFAVNATEVSHIQAGINFSVTHNLKLAIKSSGHDFLGRSTAKGSLLIWTHYLQNISFTNSFVVNGKNLGSAVTMGSGVPANTMYTATKAEGKIVVGPNTATVSTVGGYIQGGGHSAYSPTLGLGSDNALQFRVVLANGKFVTANEAENSDLFWALRGGGSGSWGVIVEGTIRTFPTFNVTEHNVILLTSPNASLTSLMELHARHIFDWDNLGAGQYFTAYSPTELEGVVNGSALELSTYFPNASTTQASTVMKPFLDAAQAMGFNITDESTQTADANDLVYSSDDSSYGINDILGSRLIPEDVYKTNPVGVGKAMEQLIDEGVLEILGHKLAGGQVAANAYIDSAVNPKWRTAKTHVIAGVDWPDSVPPSDVETIKETMTNKWVPILASLTGEPDSGSYSNEADVREPNFQVTFYGPNYARLKSIKAKYDPNDLFIVGAGVGSENWDSYGICKIH